MTAIEELRDYIRRLRVRFRLAVIARGAALITVVALVCTVLLTLLINHFAFSSASLWSARTALLAALAAGGLFGLGLPLWRLRHHLLTRAEKQFPQFDLRLRTFVDRDRGHDARRDRGHDASRDRDGALDHDGAVERDQTPRDPFVSLLAADTLRVAQETDVREAAPNAMLMTLGAAGALCLVVLIWLIRSGPGYLGYGAAALWLGPPAAPFYDIRVTPGDGIVGRHADQLITATLVGDNKSPVQIHVRPDHAAEFQQAVMQPQPRTAGFQFLIPGIAEDIEYFVKAGAVESPHFHLHVADIPKVRQIRVTYHYPEWTKLADSTEEHGGDARAVEGTEARLEVMTDRPLTNGALVLDDGRRIRLAAVQKNVYRGSITLDTNTLYHVVSQEQTGEQRISGDYFIEAEPVKPPEVALLQPAADYPASPIEEVAIRANASDPYGLNDFVLHYSVNGGPDKSIRLMKSPGANRASGTAVLDLERLKLVPGDVISVYAMAKDARSDARTDISFIQVDPFEREFSQSQQSGGAGGGGGAADDQAQIAQREKEIISATWKQARLKGADTKGAAEQAKFLSDVQATLRSQAMSLSGRVEMRDLQFANEQFRSFQEDMGAAAVAMGPAAGKLSHQLWESAVSDEQKALQYLMRAEATFRRIEVAFGSARGGGSGAVNSAGRDLASLFDLELDTQKNQYESAQSAAPAESRRSSGIDDALRKLDELERGQRQLSAQTPDAAQTAEERWQQEILRRKAEELQAQMEQLARSGQSGANSNKGRAGNALQQARDRLRQAESDMRRAVDEHDRANARAAANELREAIARLGDLQHQDAAARVSSLGEEAGRIADRQREQAERLKRMLDARSAVGRGGIPQPGQRGEDIRQFIDDRQKLADDLARLTAGLRTAEEAARERNHDAAERLRSAIGDLEQADTETKLQRSADLLRRGYGPITDAGEDEFRTELRNLKDQIGEAGRAMATTDARPDNPLESLDRLRAQLASARDTSGSINDGGQATRGGDAGGLINGGYDTGVDPASAANRRPHATGVEHAGVTPQTAENYRAEVKELGRLRRAIPEDAAARREVDSLIKQMQGLDPRRFPGNPEMVEALYAKALSSVDKLELQLRREPNRTAAVDIRTDNPAPVPSEYEAAVADYFRRLSKASPDAASNRR